MESAQEVVSVGVGPLHLGILRIQQIACAEKLALLLTHDGAVYSLPYDTMTPQLVPGKCSVVNFFYNKQIVYGYVWLFLIYDFHLGKYLSTSNFLYANLVTPTT